MKYASNEENALVVEVFLPKRLDYAGKVAQVLRAFETISRALRIPAVKKYIKLHPEHSRMVRQVIRAIVTGHSIYEVDGRYSSAKGPVDERTLVIRFIVTRSDIGGISDEEFHEIAKTVIHHLVAGRLAEELQSEEEIWMVTHPTQLFRWVKQKEKEKS